VRIDPDPRPLTILNRSEGAAKRQCDIVRARKRNLKNGGGQAERLERDRADSNKARLENAAILTDEPKMIREDKHTLLLEYLQEIGKGVWFGKLRQRELMVTWGQTLVIGVGGGGGGGVLGGDAVKASSFHELQKLSYNRYWKKNHGRDAKDKSRGRKKKTRCKRGKVTI